MQQTGKKNKNRWRRSESFLKIVAAVVSLLFAALMLYPLIFAISSSMKDNAKIYEVPPKLLPDAANSVLNRWILQSAFCLIRVSLYCKKPGNFSGKFPGKFLFHQIIK